MDKENRIMEACKILMEECCDNDSNNIQVKVEYKNDIIKCIFDFAIYDNTNKEEYNNGKTDEH